MKQDGSDTQCQSCHNGISIFLLVFTIIKEKVAEKEKTSTELANVLSVKKTI